MTDTPRFALPTHTIHSLAGLPEWLSLAIDHRTRWEAMDGRFRAGESGYDHQVAVQNCLFLEGAWNGFRAGFEFMDARALDVDERSFVNNTHTNQADFLQLYVAWSTRDILSSGLGLDAKFGRQTLDLGSRRLVARNAFRNTINSFTGLYLRLRDGKGRWNVQAFATQPVLRLPDDTSEVRDGVREWDEQDYRTFFSGVIVDTAPIALGIRAEGYLYHLDEHDRPGNATRNRRLFTPGFRIGRAAAPGTVDLEVEGAFQLGESRASTASTDRRDLRHRAWFVHLQSGYTLPIAWSPRGIALYDYVSGDDDPTDRVNERFDTLYGARRWEYGPTGIFGAFARGNVNSPGGRIALTPHGDVVANVGYRAFWLAASRDQWVGSGLQDSTGRSGDFIGHLVEFQARWDILENVALEGGYAVLLKGEFARSAPKAPSDGDVNYVYVQTLLRF